MKKKEQPKPNIEAQKIAAQHLADGIPYKMYRIAIKGTLAKSSSIKRHVGLGIAEWKVLLIIGTYAPLSTNAVAARSSLDKPTISRTTDRLVARGLVDRTRDRNDQRKLVLRLTQKGAKKYEELVSVLTKWDASLLSRLGEGQLRQFNRILDLLDDGIDEVDEEFNTDHSTRSKLQKTVNGSQLIVR